MFGAGDKTKPNQSDCCLNASGTVSELASLFFHPPHLLWYYQNHYCNCWVTFSIRHAYIWGQKRAQSRSIFPFLTATLLITVLIYSYLRHKMKCLSINRARALGFLWTGGTMGCITQQSGAEEGGRRMSYTGNGAGGSSGGRGGSAPLLLYKSSTDAFTGPFPTSEGRCS